MAETLPAFAGLFTVCFLAATFLPAQSEVLLAGMVLAERYPLAAMIAVATVGNVLGSMVNWWLGLNLARFEGRRWFPVTREQAARAEGWYHRWGRWSLLLSWAPFIGDPLTLVAGMLRERLEVFLVFVALAKLGRYILVVWLAERWIAY
jgi:membrane protein YqaA with SNARE-associated domain